MNAAEKAASVRPVVWARRSVLRTAAVSLTAIAGSSVAAWVGAAEARAAGSPLKLLTVGEARTLEAFGEALAPGATQAGIAHFVDHHLSVDAADSLLMLRYLDWPTPYAPFYKAGLGALEQQIRRQLNTAPADVTEAQWSTFIGGMQGGDPAAWNGIPPGLFYFAVRSDAVDVVYGTEAGFARLGIPYMAHIVPPSPW